MEGQLGQRTFLNEAANCNEKRNTEKKLVNLKISLKS